MGIHSLANAKSCAGLRENSVAGEMPPPTGHTQVLGPLSGTAPEDALETPRGRAAEANPTPWASHKYKNRKHLVI